jgi:hypothetical protein
MGGCDTQQAFPVDSFYYHINHIERDCLLHTDSIWLPHSELHVPPASSPAPTSTTNLMSILRAPSSPKRLSRRLPPVAAGKWDPQQPPSAGSSPAAAAATAGPGKAAETAPHACSRAAMNCRTPGAEKNSLWSSTTSSWWAHTSSCSSICIAAASDPSSSEHGTASASTCARNVARALEVEPRRAAAAPNAARAWDRIAASAAAAAAWRRSRMLDSIAAKLERRGLMSRAAPFPADDTSPCCCITAMLALAGRRCVAPLMLPKGPSCLPVLLPRPGPAVSWLSLSRRCKRQCRGEGPPRPARGAHVL